MNAQIQINQEISNFNIAGKSAYRLDDHHKKSSQEIFNSFDGDKNGKISKEEFKIILKNLRDSSNEDEMNQIFKNYDLDASNYLDLDEFMGFVKYKLTKETLKLASSKSLSYNFENKELELLIPYLDMAPYFKGDVLTILNNPDEGPLITLETASHVPTNQKLNNTFSKKKDKKVIAESKGIAIKLNVEKIRQLVKQYPLIALKLNQALSTQLTPIMKNSIKSDQIIVN